MDKTPTFFTDDFGLLHQFLPPVFRQGRDVNPQHARAIVGWGQIQVRHSDRFLIITPRVGCMYNSTVSDGVNGLKTQLWM